MEAESGAERGGEEMGGVKSREKVSVLHKNDTGNDSLGGRIHGRRVAEQPVTA